MKIIDLSVSNFVGMTRFSGDYHASFSSKTTGTYDRDGCLVHKIEMATHTGTHIDAPAHFFSNGTTIDNVSLDLLVSDCIVCKLEGVCDNGRITASQIRHLPVNPDLGVLINTGWYKKWDLDAFYKDFPVLEPGAVEILINKGAKFLACDLPLGAEVHRIVLGADRILIENITNLDAIESDRIRLLALPLKLRGVDGAPARVLAVTEY